MVTGVASRPPAETDAGAGGAIASDSVSFAGAPSLTGISATGATAAIGALDNVGFAMRVLSGFGARTLFDVALLDAHRGWRGRGDRARRSSRPGDRLASVESVQRGRRIARVSRIANVRARRQRRVPKEDAGTRARPPPRGRRRCPKRPCVDAAASSRASVDAARCEGSRAQQQTRRETRRSGQQTALPDAGISADGGGAVFDLFTFTRLRLLRAASPARPSPPPPTPRLSS